MPDDTASTTELWERIEGHGLWRWPDKSGTGDALDSLRSRMERMEEELEALRGDLRKMNRLSMSSDDDVTPAEMYPAWREEA